ncbi:MAG: M20 family metallopeptidase, partial [Chloroflexi bacterium]|nr:M20 family metallopeptidase [Chloroflexota bacterium]
HVEQLKQRVCEAVNRRAAQLIETADWIHAHPEIGHQEVEAARRLSGMLQSEGIPVEMGTAGMATAFKAELGGQRAARPRVAILAEYDALPGLGHGCGHNLIGTSAVGAGLALVEVAPELDGSIWILGTPAEESAAPNSGGKVHMVNAGIFADVDAAIMFHPATETAVTLDRSLAARGFEFYFHGRAAHAAGAPEEGINALDAVVLLYNAISVLRQQMRSDVRIHGIILHGGAAANIIPDYAAIRYRTRADDSDYLADVVQRVIACAEGAAKATGCRLEWSEYMPGYENSMPNRVLLELITGNMRALGLSVNNERRRSGRGSTDFGNVSRRVPGIEARLAITDDWEVPGHSIEFREAAGSDQGRQAMLNAAKSLAMTAIDLLTEPQHLKQARAVFDEDMRKSKRNRLIGSGL